MRPSRRQPDELRAISLERGVVKYAEGSCFVKFGDTHVLITATLLPSIVADVGGANLMSWPTTAFVASSIVAATGAGIVSSAVGNRRAFCGGAMVYASVPSCARWRHRLPW